MTNATVEQKDYREIDVSDGDVVYADPPYASTTGYNRDFNSAEFWQKMDKWSDIGASVFVSEYNAPQHWVPIWEKLITQTLRGNVKISKAPVTEKLFTRR